MSRTICIVAGEHSGDRLGAGLAQALRQRDPDLRLIGMGGEQMRASGVDLLVDATRLGVTGLVEVLRRLGEFRAVFRRIRNRFEQNPPDLFVPVDYPDFNLRLCGVARDNGIPVVYFVSPQVWAWRRRRVRHIARTVRKMLVIFPFEVEFYERHGVPATFVGHPMVERLEHIAPKDECRKLLGLPPEEPVVALLPGSRVNEVERLLPGMVSAASLLTERIPGVHYVLPVAAGIDSSLLDQALGGRAPVLRFHDHYEELVRASDVAAVASGTATLETALLGTPLAVVYRLHPLTYLMSRALVRVDHIAMPNLIAGHRAVPELVQSGFTPENLAGHLERFLTDPAARARVLEELSVVRERLERPDPFGTAAEEVLEELGRAGAPSGA